MLIPIFLVLVVLFLAYANGANDNFKGVATLWGSGTTSYRKALFWATLTTFMGSITAVFAASQLMSAFSGKGLVPDTVTANPAFLISVALGASLTVCLATLIRIPISTTHSLIGGLLGAGIAASGSEVNAGTLLTVFLLPLLVSPALSMVLAFMIHPLMKMAGKKCGISHQMCLCVDGKTEPVSVGPDGAMVLRSTGIAVTVDELQHCREHYKGSILGIDIHGMLDRLHFLSAGAVSFARGLNDTPKIAGLLFVMSAFSLKLNILVLGIAMALGGIIHAKRVADTLSRKITAMNHGEGMSANLVTAFLVIAASKVGMPVSTTHVSCGALFGIGLANKKADIRVIGKIILAWIITLPVAGLLSGMVYVCFNQG